uniref:Ubiquitin carboxyl-terminal hydrolase n=1 Tax=Dugesia japonica TaxID=6161 RepID=A0A221C9L3_DUGJA|nr:ubiquitin specific protease [Dugesia japonica]
MQTDVGIFQRFVVEENTELRVELFPLKLKFQIYGDVNDNVIEQTFNSKTKLIDIEKFVQEAYNIPEGAIFQLIQEHDNESLHVIHFSSETTSLSDARLTQYNKLYVDVRNSEGEFSFKENRSHSYANSSGAVKGGSSSVAYGPYLPSSPSTCKTDEPINDSRYTPGVCGLSNLGNTCFMNSAIQCISNVRPITDYFLKNSWMSDLNKDNPLGMEGRIATAYANLIREMWSGKVPYALPREFKYEVAQFAPQFCGYSQHDSQELMMFLLDGLHEDLNRITNKPYVEQKNQTNQPDYIVAEQNWNYHLKRNNSIIVDYFHGQLKSKVVCPDCKFVSVTFDPFASLSLPLKHSYNQPVIFYPLDPSRPISELNVNIYKNTSIESLKKFVYKEIEWNQNNEIIIAHVKSSKICRYYKENEYQLNTPIDNYIIFYEVSPLQPDNCYIDISFKEKSMVNFCSLPIIVQVPKKLNWNNFILAIKPQMSRFFNELMFDGDIDLLPEYQDNKIDFIDIPSCIDDNNDNNSDFEKSESKSNSSTDSSKTVNGNPFKNIFSVILSEISSTSTNDHEINPLSRNRSLKAEADQHIVVEWSSEGMKNYHKNVKKISINCTQQIPKLTIEDCLKQFLCEEYLGQKDLWFCPKCKKDEAASKKLDIWKLPKVLVLHLKRFKATSYFGDKINNEVIFPTKNLNLCQYVPKVENEDDYIYDLVAVSNHVGCLAGGHYFAFAKNYLDNRWYKFDDSNTSCVDENEIVTKSAYVLVYVARSCNNEYNLPAMMNGHSYTQCNDMAVDINSPE